MPKQQVKVRGVKKAQKSFTDAAGHVFSDAIKETLEEMRNPLSFEPLDLVFEEVKPDMSMLGEFNSEELLQEIFNRVWHEKNPFDDGPMQTAMRVLKYWKEYQGEEEEDFKFTTFPAEQGQMVVVDHIEFSSLCAHHLLPFYGLAHVGYIPNQLQVGLSKIPRLVGHLAKRPQVQERLGQQIAKELKDRLQPQGVIVALEARHTCMACRGVHSHNAMMRTSVLKGVFLTNSAARDEFFTLMRGSVL